MEETDYIKEAMELLNGEPSVEIEAPRQVTERHGNTLVEVERTAFVKLYTSFKAELKDMKGDDLKVWIYLALSINRYTKDARPGLRKIAEDTNISINTVRGIIDRLENSGLLDVEKAGGRRNYYRPADYASVSKTDTVRETVSNESKTVSKKDETVLTVRRDSAQLEELESTRVKKTSSKNEKKGDVIDGLLFYGKQAKDQGVDKVEELLCEIERGIHVNIQRSNDNQIIARKILKDGREFGRWLTWRIQDEWWAARLYIFADLTKMWEQWPAAFETKTDETRPEYQPFPLAGE